MGGFHYWPDPPANPAVVCKCGHGLSVHTGSGVAGIPCKVCGTTRSSGWLMGTCTGWDPPIQGEERDAHAHLLDSEHGSAAGADVTGPAGATTPTGPPAGPPDYVATQQTLRGFARYAADWLKPKMPDGYEMPFSLIQLRTALLTGADALERLRDPAGPPDLDQAIQAADAAVRLQRIHDGLQHGSYVAQWGDYAALLAGADALEQGPLLERDLRVAQTQIDQLRIFHHATQAKVLAYHEALTNREHGGLAADRLVQALIDLVDAFGDPALDQAAPEQRP